MRLLQAAIVAYIIGLFTFYTCATFDTTAWDWTYFAWSKLCDIGVIGWGLVYFNLKPNIRDVVIPIFWFSVARFLLDIQTYFTGIGVNNNQIVAASFLALIVLISVLTWQEFKKIRKHLT